MPLGTTAAVVIGGFPLGESDRVVTFFSREHGKLRGVAKAARRLRSRFGGALELFTHGRLIFFDTGRSELVRIDHFDITHPFDRLRGDLERLGQASWMVECVSRLTGERDRHVALYGLLLRSFRAMERAASPVRVAVCFGVRALDALGHRPRLDRCGRCGRAWPFARPRLDEEGLVCERCVAGEGDGTPLSPAAVAALGRLRAVAWEEALGGRIGGTEAELRRALEAQMARLIGQPTRSDKFLREVVRAGGRRGGDEASA